MPCPWRHRSLPQVAEGGSHAPSGRSEGRSDGVQQLLPDVAPSSERRSPAARGGVHGWRWLTRGEAKGGGTDSMALGEPQDLLGSFPSDPPAPAGEGFPALLEGQHLALGEAGVALAGRVTRGQQG